MLIPECPEGDVSPGSKTSCPNEAREGFLKRRSLVVDEDRFFISGPAVVQILRDNRPVRRRFDFSLPRVGGLLPQPEMAEDAFYDVLFMNEADDLHFMGASGTTERVHFPDFFMSSRHVLDGTRRG